MENRTASYTSASVFPAKILVNTDLMRKITEEKKIPPVHVQLNVTNKCNLDCPFCSCSARDKRVELSYDDIMEIMTKAKRVGCESTTVTGAGEPTCHPKIFDIIRGIRDMGIEIGLVTNGLLLGEVPTDVFSRITWIRISSGDNRGFPDRYMKMLEEAVERGKNIDWAFSHVLTRKPNYKTVRGVINFANEHAFTHVRLVSDLLDLEAVRDIEIIKKNLRESDTDDHLVIYQGRKQYESGTRECYISLLKPVVTPRGTLQACCGVQYALENPIRDYSKEMDMDFSAKDIDKLYEQQKYFDGSVCSRCYYMDYNRALKVLLSDVHHKVFV